MPMTFSYWFLLSYFVATALHLLQIATVTVTVLLLLLLSKLSYYRATKYSAVDILSPGVVELTTQLLILTNILWLPLCQINKSG